MFGTLTTTVASNGAAMAITVGGTFAGAGSGELSRFELHDTNATNNNLFIG